MLFTSLLATCRCMIKKLFCKLQLFLKYKPIIFWFSINLQWTIKNWTSFDYQEVENWNKALIELHKWINSSLCCTNTGFIFFPELFFPMHNITSAFPILIFYQLKASTSYRQNFKFGLIARNYTRCFSFSSFVQIKKSKFALKLSFICFKH